MKADSTTKNTKRNSSHETGHHSHIKPQEGVTLYHVYQELCRYLDAPADHLTNSTWKTGGEAAREVKPWPMTATEMLGNYIDKILDEISMGSS